MLDHFHAIAGAMANTPNLRVGELQLQPPVLTGEPLESPVRSVPDWISEHARRQPGGTALVSGGAETS